MSKYRRINEQGWEVVYEVPEDLERLLDAKGIVAGATDGASDLATILARLYITAAMNGFSLQTTAVNEGERRLDVTVVDLRAGG